jgi:hypothetical protein
MTINKLKDSLRSANFGFYGAKNKEDLVHLYISHGLHKKDTISQIEPKSPSNSPPHYEPKSPEVKVKTPEVKVKTVKAKPVSVKAKPVSVKALEPTEELILSIIISAHGEESYDWPPKAPIAQYYRNNVRVYSRGCVPGVITIRNRSHIRKSINDSYNIFQKNPESATEEIMAEYTGLDKEYYTDFLDNSDICKFQPTPEDIKDVIENKDRCGGLSTYLSQKDFGFVEHDHEASLHSSALHFREFMESRGLNVSDIRFKITDTDGSVRYRQIFNPVHEYDKYMDTNPNVFQNRFDITQFNLIYRHGLEFILKVLHKEELIVPALEILDFKEGEDKLSKINLEQLYRFFELVGIKYVNIIDHSCRSFHWNWKMTKPKREKMFKKEQQYSVKPVAFGKRSTLKSKKRSDSKRLKSKHSTLKGKRSDSKYSRKI